MIRNQMDVRSGIHNLNQLVDNQLGSNAYNIVHNVYLNMEWLNRLLMDLPVFNQINQNTHYLNLIASHINDIELLSTNINLIKEVNLDLPSVVEVLPVLKEFNEKINYLKCLVDSYDDKANAMFTEIQNKLDTVECSIVNVTCVLQDQVRKAEEQLRLITDIQLERIKEQSKQIEDKYELFCDYLPALDNFVKHQDRIVKSLAHLEASELVQNYLNTSSDCVRQEAFHAIEKSECLGNCEDFNRTLLNFSPRTDNLEAVLNRGMGDKHCEY